MKNVDESDFNFTAGHVRFKSAEDMLKHYKGLYGERVEMDTQVKIIKFKLLQP